VSVEVVGGGSSALRFPDGSGRTLAELLAHAEAGAVIDIAPGRHVGPIVLDRPVTLRGAGDLSRISVLGRSSVVRVALAAGARVVLESLLLEGGDAEFGGGLCLSSGRVLLHNVHIVRCRASQAGGALHVASGELEGNLLRIEGTVAERGGAIGVQGRGELRLRESQIVRAEARQGGALAVEEGGRAELESLTVRKARATGASGGQAIWVRGSSSHRPSVGLRRVRLEDAPLGMPVVVDGEHPGQVRLLECDVPRVVLGAPGVVDAGHNRWR
jgi:hypothetical protein